MEKHFQKEWCDRFMTPNTPKGKGGDYYLRLSCTNLECKRMDSKI